MSRCVRITKHNQQQRSCILVQTRTQHKKRVPTVEEEMSLVLFSIVTGKYKITCDRQVCRPRHGGPRTPSRTTDLDCAFVENAHFTPILDCEMSTEYYGVLVTRPGRHSTWCEQSRRGLGMRRARTQSTHLPFYSTAAGFPSCGPASPARSCD